MSEHSNHGRRERGENKPDHDRADGGGSFVPDRIENKVGQVDKIKHEEQRPLPAGNDQPCEGLGGEQNYGSEQNGEVHRYRILRDRDACGKNDCGKPQHQANVEDIASHDVSQSNVALPRAPVSSAPVAGLKRAVLVP